MNSRKPTKAESVYLEAIRRGGCLACDAMGHDTDVPPEYLAIHHNSEVGSRVKYAHFFASCLCPFHHQGTLPPGCKMPSGEPVRHPVLAPKVSFQELIGTDLQLAEMSWERLSFDDIDQIGELSGIWHFEDLLKIWDKTQN